MTDDHFSMTMGEILETKGDLIHRIHGTASLSEAIEKLVDLAIGSLLLVENDGLVRMENPVGIVTDRDIIRVLASREDLLTLCLD